MNTPEVPSHSRSPWTTPAGASPVPHAQVQEAKDQASLGDTQAAASSLQQLKALALQLTGTGLCRVACPGKRRV